MADHSKVQAALDTSVALAIAEMNENIYASLLNEIETNVHRLELLSKVVYGLSHAAARSWRSPSHEFDAANDLGETDSDPLSRRHFLLSPLAKLEDHGHRRLA